MNFMDIDSLIVRPGDRILVTGAAGFIGRRVVSALLNWVLVIYGVSRGHLARWMDSMRYSVFMKIVHE